MSCHVLVDCNTTSAVSSKHRRPLLEAAVVPGDAQMVGGVVEGGMKGDIVLFLELNTLRVAYTQGPVSWSTP
jgi:hypothetical protein